MFATESCVPRYSIAGCFLFTSSYMGKRPESADKKQEVDVIRGGVDKRLASARRSCIIVCKASGTVIFNNLISSHNWRIFLFMCAIAKG